MIYVARIDDAFARFKLQRPIFSRYPRSAFSFSKRYKFPVSNSQREKYYISNSVASIHPIHSVNLIESRAVFPPPPPRLSFYQLIQPSSILSLIAKLSFVNEGFFFTPSKKKKNSQSRENQRNRKSISWVISRKKGPEFTSILWRMDISPGGRPSSGNGARFNFQIIET